MESERRRLKTADRVFDILEFIADNDGSSVSEIASAMDIAKSTSHQYLYTLKDLEYLIQKGEEYYLSLKFVQFADLAKDRYEITDVVTPTLQQLASKTDEAAWIIVEEHGYAVYLQNELGEQAIQTHAEIGKFEYLHCLASGKAIMAEMDEDRLSDILERHGLPEKTKWTVTDIDTLYGELAEIREQGYATNDEEATTGVGAVAAPIVTEDDTVVGSICVSGPQRRIEKKRATMSLPELVREAAEEIELKLTWE